MLHPKRSRAARTRGPDPRSPMNLPDVDTPGWGKPLPARVTKEDLRGEQREMILQRIREMGRQALTIYEASQELGISPMTFNRWLADDAAVLEAFSLGADMANKRVEQALFHKAIGYTYPAEKIAINADGVVTRVRYTEHVPPDNTAMIFWLKNRERDRWRDVQKVEVEDVTQEKGKDPRALAMALLAIMREAVEADVEEALTIEHKDAAE